MKTRRIPKLDPISSPLDDAAFRAYVYRHGIIDHAMLWHALANGWCGGQRGQRSGLPAEFPEFRYQAGNRADQASLILFFPTELRPKVRYSRNLSSAWIQIDQRMIPETLKPSLEMRPVREVVDIAGIGDWIILKASETDGTMTLRIHPKETS